VKEPSAVFSNGPIPEDQWVEGPLPQGATCRTTEWLGVGLGLPLTRDVVERRESRIPSQPLIPARIRILAELPINGPISDVA
jgi:hypothetical protein